jgi:16S rRNA (cytosine967-C5)-methyltransferase
VLTRVAKDKAFAAASLESELDRAVQLDPRDRRLCTEIVFGVLRTQAFLLDQIARFALKGLSNLDPQTKAHLLVAAYQILLLDRVPAFAAVDEAVGNIQRSRGAGLSRFANALLRRLSEKVAEKGRPTSLDAIHFSAPKWLLESLSRTLGSSEAAAQFLDAGPWPPPTCLRLKVSESRDKWLETLAAQLPAAEIKPGSISPLCICLRGAGRSSAWPGFGSAWTIQEEGSQVLGLLVGARPGEKILDACAGRGNKSSLLSECLGDSGKLCAADLHQNKLNTLCESLAASHLSLHATYAVDWSIGPGDVPDDFNRVLVDSPCTGIGTIRRRPDLLTRDIQSSLADLPKLQVAILENAATRCRKGGRVIYSVCSVLREEAEDVVAAVLARNPWLKPVPFDAPLLADFVGNQTSFRLLPTKHGTDGYFIASFIRE